MGQQSEPVKAPAEQVIKEIRRATRRQFSAEEKIRIVLSGLRGEDSIAELCRREGIVQNLYYRWSKEFLEAGKKRLAGDTARAATPQEVKDLSREAGALKEVVAELVLENRLLKKSTIGAGEDEALDTPLPRSWKSSGWSRARRCRCATRWQSSASRGRPSIAGMTGIARAGPMPWRTEYRERSASGTAFRRWCATASSSARSTSRPCRRASW